MKYLQHTFWAFLLTVLCSCGEDRTGEFYALIEDRQWIEETMQANYLWAEDMPVIENEDDYFKEPQAFFKSLLSKNAMNGKGDKYSYMEEDPKAPQQESRSQMLDRTSTYGMEFELTNDPTGTTNHIHAHVLYVLDGSPAQQAGITRGDWLSSVDGQRITTSNYQLLKNGGSIKVARTRIYSTELGYTWQPADTLNLAASITMEINPFLIDTLYQVEGQRIAYLMYNEFSTGPENKGTEETYNEQMKAIFANFKAQQPDALILDLRYNNGGYLQCAQALGSLIAPASALGKNFVNLQFNAKANPQKKAYPLLESYAEANLDLGKVYILTTNHTASASEALINGLIPYMGKENVILIGERTEGKNVAMTAFRNETYGITLWPVVAYTSNAEDFSDYGDGFEPTHELTERNIVDWYPLGDNREYLLKNAISLITTGSIADN